MSFLAPAAAWLFAALAPLVLLHMLRLKRPPQRVSSLVLWRQTLQDERVNAPLRRLRKSWLLLLQIALLVALALAAMQPLFGSRALGAALVLVLDRSASMAARAEPGGKTRLELAKQRAQELLDSAAGSDVALVTFADHAELLAPFSDDTRALSRALARVQVEDVADDLAAALRLVAALGSQRALSRVVLLSDGNLPDVSDFALPFSLEVERVAPAGGNLGIVRLAARRDAQGFRLFAAVASSGAADSAGLQVEVDGEVRGTVTVTPGPDAAERVELPLAAQDLPSDRRALVTLRLLPRGFDALPSDDVAHLVLEPGRDLRVALRGDKLDAIRQVLAGQTGLSLDAAEPPDLLITRDALGADDQAPVTLSVGSVPVALAGVVAPAEGQARVVDQDRIDPLLTHVELADLVVLGDILWQPDQGEADLERQGFTTLVHGSRGPLLVRRRSPLGDRTAFALLFDPERSTLPYRVAFPVLLSNLLNVARDAAGLREQPAPRTGNLPALTAQGSELVCQMPNGAVQTLRVAQDGQVRGARAPQVGIYRLRDAQGERPYGVSLLDGGESRLAPREQLRVGDLAVAARASGASAAASLWPHLLGAALLLACLEWWLFRRAGKAVAA